MTVETILQIGTQALLVTLYVVGPPLAAAMLVGLVVAVLQAATQIQETTLSFVPKIIAVGIAILVSGRWSISHLVTFFHNLMQQLEGMGH